MTLASNSDAPAGNSTKRLVSWLDPCSSRQQRAQPKASQPVRHSFAEHVQPFVTDRHPPKKPASELEHIERMLKKIPPQAMASGGAAVGKTLAPAVQEVEPLGKSGRLALLGGAAMECALSQPPIITAASHPAATEASEPPQDSGCPKPATAPVNSIGVRSSGRHKHRPARLED